MHATHFYRHQLSDWFQNRFCDHGAPFTPRITHVPRVLWEVTLLSMFASMQLSSKRWNETRFIPSPWDECMRRIPTDISFRTGSRIVFATTARPLTLAFHGHVDAAQHCTASQSQIHTLHLAVRATHFHRHQSPGRSVAVLRAQRHHPFQYSVVGVHAPVSCHEVGPQSAPGVKL